MVSLKTAIKPALIAFIFLCSIGAIVYWLWQRQPTAEVPPASSQTQLQIQEEKEKVALEILPASGTVLSQTSTVFEGKTQPSNFILISSNNTLGITQSNQDGIFHIETELTEGLNLIDIYSLDSSLIEQDLVSLILYVDQENKVDTVFAGPVNSIFDDIITITFGATEQTIRQKSSTDLILPQAETDEEDTDIRVGDYLIALGSLQNEKEFDAESIEIIRQNKPQNFEMYVAGLLLSNLNENIFSLKSQKDSEIIELTIDDETTITLNGRDAEAESIEKDKGAIILYYTEDRENIADLVYLLP